MEADTLNSDFLSGFFDITVHPLTIGVILNLIVVCALLVLSALMSGSEMAFFSLNPVQLSKIRNTSSRTNNIIIELLEKPQRLLATILIANNFVNVGIVILCNFITNSLLDFTQSELAGFLFQVVIISFLLLIFGEILPKIYAGSATAKFAGFMAYPMLGLVKFFYPLSSVLMMSQKIVNRKIDNKNINLSIDVLSNALDIAENQLHEEKKILKGIVKFGNIEACEIMKSRIDVVAVDYSLKYNELLEIINKSGYSRIPIFEGTFDNIKGVLYIKDLLPYLYENEQFNWQTLIRPAYIIPEVKKINDLLQEFQLKKIHLAVVVDEYGGTQGIVTMEDIFEEIVGEINDEFDEDNELLYKKIDDSNYLFDGKILLTDFYRVFETETSIFEQVKGDAETLAGVILEIRGEFPKKGDIITYKNFDFKIEAIDQRRIKQIKVTIRKDAISVN